MRARNNLVGQRFGRLLVCDFAEARGGKSYWLCRCDCGGKTIVCGNNLAADNTRSCGCYNRERVHQSRTNPNVPKRYSHEIVDTLRKRRETNRMTQDELAKRMGYSDKMLRDMELGRATPKLAMLDDWAQALGLKLMIMERGNE